MKTMILCGGKGTRMREETEYRPKPMVEIGGKPMLWHIMKIYAHFGFNDFVIALGYKGAMIKDYFLKHRALANDFTIHTATNDIGYHGANPDNFSVTFAETGLETLTGERLRRMRKYLDGDTFMVTYGDGVSNVPLDEVVAFHRRQGTVGTLTGVHPQSKYGLVRMDKEKNLVTGFYQKPVMSDYVNGGFMVFNAGVFDYIKEGEAIEHALARMAEHRQLSVYIHEGFWKAMDTYNEMMELNDLWEAGRPWAVWERRSLA